MSTKTFSVLELCASHVQLVPNGENCDPTPSLSIFCMGKKGFVGVKGLLYFRITKTEHQA